MAEKQQTNRRKRATRKRWKKRIHSWHPTRQPQRLVQFIYCMTVEKKTLWHEITLWPHLFLPVAISHCSSDSDSDSSSMWICRFDWQSFRKKIKKLAKKTWSLIVCLRQMICIQCARLLHTHLRTDAWIITSVECFALCRHIDSTFSPF